MCVCAQKERERQIQKDGNKHLDKEKHIQTQNTQVTNP